MIIQHNIAAINSYRNLGINQSGLNKNLEKLSSGYKINRAGDDAAGLAISESMRSQINGLNQAAKNAQDAIGLIQTAEGALTEVHSMLQRLTTLASQSANGTYNTVARGNLQSEVSELLKEIDRIANNTDFNGIKPLANEGSAGKMTFQIGPSGGETIVVNSQAMTVSGIQAAIWDSMAGFDRDKYAEDENYYDPTNGKGKADLKDIVYKFDKAQVGTDASNNNKKYDEVTVVIGAHTTGFLTSDGKVSDEFKSIMKDGKFGAPGDVDKIKDLTTKINGNVITGAANGLGIHGAKDTSADSLKKVTFNSKSNMMSTLLPTLNISGSSTVVANAAIDTINSAINAVSSYRAKLGAAQNRLEHTVNNLKVTAENITSAESRIRDTDMADEITAFTKNNILLQASQSMLAQSNSVPQSILSLLQ